MSQAARVAHWVPVTVPVVGDMVVAQAVPNPNNVIDTRFTAPPSGSLGTALPKMDGVAAVGVSVLAGREDHVHPSDTAKAAVTYVDSQDALKVAKAGDTMSGNLTLAATKTLAVGDAVGGQSTISVRGNASANQSPILEVLKGGVGSWRFAMQAGQLILANNAASTSDADLLAARGYTFWGKELSIHSTTNSVSPGTGALIVSGGAGFALNVTIGGAAGFAGAAPTDLPGYGNTNVGTVLGGFLCMSRAATPMIINQNTDGGLMLIMRSGNQVGSIAVTATATQFLQSSDERLKTDLQTFDAGRIVDETDVYSFKWRKSETPERSYGIMAQQAQDIFPAAVHHNEETDWWGIDYAQYVPVILQELKTLRARVRELEVAAGIKPPELKPPDPKGRK